MTSAENQTNVSHAPSSLRMSSQVSTLATSSTPSPTSAAVVALILSASPKIHSTSNNTNVPSISHSLRAMRPISASFSLANCVALGVSLISGG
jgi:hypothetical protein